ncbi:MAG: chromate transporter [Oscillospiraceae bacterium]|nr:chromate transporter [Oscillospiraceae bacterium]
MAKCEAKRLNFFLSTLKIGTLTFGGGFVILGQMNAEYVERHQWMTKEELTDLFALAQAPPGLPGVYAAFLVGHKLCGWLGAWLGALAIILPPFFVLIPVALLYDRFIGYAWVQGAMRGISAAVTALLLYTLLDLRKTAVKTPWHWLLFAVTLALALFTGINVMWLMLGGAIVGLLPLLRRGGRPRLSIHDPKDGGPS